MSNYLPLPEKYRQHINLKKLFKADGSYVRPAEDPVTMWAIQILATLKLLISLL
ncbi:hypothetical protein [Aphanizomenon sp. UHCC 0183]|uniref:hypothetical protein n=1 Tax=Aphanizomenon sp. UHCC 0183 TaxID=2590028 RepID=UPI0014481183|nr:hypothetical protein [Aphanizomenon sp. UHCC 0183]